MPQARVDPASAHHFRRASPVGGLAGVRAAPTLAPMESWGEQVRRAAAATLPRTDGELRLAGLDHPVEVRRDAWGVPYVSAESQADLWLAQGFITATERCFQLELALRIATGRLSEVFGDLTLPMDRFVRTIGLHRAGARIAGGYDSRSRAMMAAFRAGALAGVATIDTPVEYTVLGGSPDLPDDEASWAAATAFLAWSLSGNWDLELLRAMIATSLGPGAAANLVPPRSGSGAAADAGPAADVNVDVARALLESGLRPPPGRGSNAWAVSAARSETGSPLLANDPHLSVQQPGAWLELHLRAPGYEARGVAIPFLPGILIGTTTHHAWGITNVTGDTQDLYVERLNEDGTAARFGEGWEPVTTHREEIVVRGAEVPVVVSVIETRHGPLLDALLVGVLEPEVVRSKLGSPIALRWTGADRSIAPSSVVDVASARSFEEFRDAVRGVECPGQTFVYADVDGTIGRQCTGAYPVRSRGDGTVPVPGWSGTHEWRGFVAFEDLPWSKDPESGYVLTANDAGSFGTTPSSIGRDFHAPFRARRIAELLAARERHTVESFAVMQHDTVSIAARELVPRLLDASPPRPSTDHAIELLRSWNADLGADSPAAAIYEVWLGRIARRMLEPTLGRTLFSAYFSWRETFLCTVLPALVDDASSRWWGSAGREVLVAEALEDALDELGERVGNDPATWRWGALHHARFAAPLARLPGLGEVFTAANVEVGGDEQTVAQAGLDARDGYPAAVVASWRQVIDLADVDRSVGVLPTGQSGNPASTHWNDQAALWAAGGHHALAVSRDAVERTATTSLRLVPG
jgi:penicillin G amidase